MKKKNKDTKAGPTTINELIDDIFSEKDGIETMMPVVLEAVANQSKKTASMERIISAVAYLVSMGLFIGSIFENWLIFLGIIALIFAEHYSYSSTINQESCNSFNLAALLLRLRADDKAKGGKK